MMFDYVSGIEIKIKMVVKETDQWVSRSNKCDMVIRKLIMS